MGNLACASQSKKALPSSVPLFHQNPILKNPSLSSKPEELVPIHYDFQPKKPARKQFEGLEVKETANFLRDISVFRQVLEVNSSITQPNTLISHRFLSPEKEGAGEIKNRAYQAYTLIQESSTKNTQNNNKNPSFSHKKKEEASISGRKSFMELFAEEEKLMIKPKKPGENQAKSGKETKNSTPNFYRSIEINELLAYLPKNPSFFSNLSEEQPRILGVKQTKLPSFRISSENPMDLEDLEQKTMKEFDINSDEILAEESSSESSIPEHIHLNLIDLLQNELKTRKNSLSIKETPVKVLPKQHKSQIEKGKMVRNDSESSFRTLKKTDYVSPLKKNRSAQKESLHLSKNIT